MKIALIQDELVARGGSEQVFLQFVKSYPQADIFTFCWNKKIWPEFSEFNVKTHPLGFFVRNHKMFQIFFPIIAFCMAFWNLKKYDLIISSSASTAKYIRNFSGYHACYCYTPTRAVWFSNLYFSKKNLEFIIFKFFHPLLKYFDKKTSNYIDLFLTISNTSKINILKIYGKDAVVISAPIKDTFFTFASKQNYKKKLDYFVLVSRLEVWKKVEHVIDAFNINKLNLIVVGNGSLFDKINKKRNKNISLIKYLCDYDLREIIFNSKAAICPTESEFGLVPIEAAALGVPAVCYAKGEVLNIMKSDDRKKTYAFFYKKQNPKYLNSAVNELLASKVSKRDLKNHAKKFSGSFFRKKLITEISKFMEAQNECK